MNEKSFTESQVKEMIQEIADRLYYVDCLTIEKAKRIVKHVALKSGIKIE